MKILPHLVECAKARRRTNYEEIATSLNVDARFFSRPLIFIRDFICTTHNLPPLTVLVERKGGVTSSSSFDPVQFAVLNLKAFNAKEAEMIEKVYDYPNWDRALAGLQELYGTP